MTVSGMNSSMAGSLFSGLSSGGGGMYSSLGEYSSIRSGSYGKLLSSYYGQQGGNSASVGSSATRKSGGTDRTSRGFTEAYKRAQEQKANSTSQKGQSYQSKVEAEAKKVSSSVASYSNETVAALDQLRSADTFKKNAAGNYDTEKIYKAVQSYVDAYNGMTEKAADSKVSGVTSNVSSIQSTTKAYSDQLSKIGVTIGENGKLSLNEETFKKSNMSDVQSLFDKGSYGYSARTSAYMTGYYAKQDINNSTGYGSNGAFSFSDLMSNFQTSI